jgi:predicted kinase
MNTLIMTVGLPRSGKSTWAKEHAKRTNAVVVSPDAIRLAISGQRFVIEAEPAVWAVTLFMVRALFGAGHETVILDCTNLEKERRAPWLREWRADSNIVFVLFNTDADTCKDRAIDDGMDDLLPIIDKMNAGWERTHYPETDGISVVNGLKERSHELVYTLNPAY